jgi:HD-like signal output (HDOD) protein
MENSFHQPSQALPLNTAVAVQLLDLFRNPDRDVDRIVEFISRDPVLRAETLRRSNNAVFGSADRTSDVFEAVSRLGFYEIYDIVLDSVNGLPPAAGTPSLFPEDQF